MPAKVITVRGKDSEGEGAPAETGAGGGTDLDALLAEINAEDAGATAGGDDGQPSPDAAAAPAPDAEEDEQPDPGERSTTVVSQYFLDDGEWDDSNKNVGQFLEKPGDLKELADATLEDFEREPLLRDEALARIGEAGGEASEEKLMERLNAAAAYDEKAEAVAAATAKKPVGGEGDEVPGPGAEEKA